jgi:parallel beta-helix repeat protein
MNDCHQNERTANEKVCNKPEIQSSKHDLRSDPVSWEQRTRDMKTIHQLTFSLFLLAIVHLPHSVFGQGNLNPPGPPAPMFRTLEQVQPRIPIGTNSTPGDTNTLFKITQPGSYYLTTNITGVAGKHGIWIASSGVTLDLMGFELAGVSNSLNGINITPGVALITLANIAVRNGTVHGWGDNGIFSQTGIPPVTACQYQELRLSNNGEGGLISGLNSVVANCTAAFNSNIGISASDGSVITGCTAYQNGGNGLVVGSGSVVIACTATDNNSGIFAGDGSTVSHCVARANTLEGITATERCSILRNNCTQNGVGIRVFVSIDSSGRGNRIEDNQLTGNGQGMSVGGGDNLVLRNSAHNNTTNYFIVSGNKVGVIVTPPDSSAISGSTGGAGLGTTDPWANFSY